MSFSRRHLLAAASGTALASGPLRVAMAANNDPTRDILVVLFMRGGQDGLQLVAPAGDANYMRARPNIRVQSSGPQAGIGVGTLSGVDMYLHPNLAELKGLYDAGNLAIVQAVGIPTTDRSHFICQSMMERGLGDGETSNGKGWLARHIPSLGSPRAPLATVSGGTNLPGSLSGDAGAVAVSDAAYFSIAGGDEVAAQLVRAVNAGTGPHQTAMRSLVETVSTVQSGLHDLRKRDQTSDIDYGFSTFGDGLKSLASLIKMEIGVDTATLDMASWDHHTGLANSFGFIATDLSRALTGFWKDLEKYQKRLTIITMTEFGRRFTENSSRGLDHGAASTMLMLGGSVNGGRVYGDWPGTRAQELDNDSLRATIDYRRVLAEVLVKRHGERTLGQIFPTLKYQPLGLLQGDDSGIL